LSANPYETFGNISLQPEKYYIIALGGECILLKPISGEFKNIHIIHSDIDGRSLICRNKNDEKQSYVINHYKNRETIEKILPQVITLYHSGYKYFNAFYIEDSQLYTVFKHTEVPQADIYFKANKTSLNDIINISDSLLSEIALMDSLPSLLVSPVLDYRNICIGEHNTVCIRHSILNFEEQNYEESHVKLTGKILGKFFSYSDNVPETLQKFLEKCRAGKFQSVSKAHDAYREAVKSYLQDTSEKKDRNTWSYVTIDSKLKKALSPEPKWKRTTRKATGIAVLFIMILGITFFIYGIISGLKPQPGNYDIPVTTNRDGINDTADDTYSANINEADTSNNNLINSRDGTYEDNSKSTSGNGVKTAVKAYSTEGSTGYDTNYDLAIEPVEPDDKPGETGDVPIEQGGQKDQPASSVQMVTGQSGNGEYLLYTVKEGDWLIKISREFYGTDEYYLYIAEYNKIDVNADLMPGQVLKIPVIK